MSSGLRVAGTFLSSRLPEERTETRAFSTARTTRGGCSEGPAAADTGVCDAHVSGGTDRWIGKANPRKDVG